MPVWLAVGIVLIASEEVASFDVFHAACPRTPLAARSGDRIIYIFVLYFVHAVKLTQSSLLFCRAYSRE